MISLVNHNLQLADLCRRYGVQRLEVFGSASSGEGFDAERSDIDLIVEFRPGQDLGPWLAHYFELRDALAKLFGRPVDLVMEGALKNQRFMREVNRTRRTLYAA